jgi:hypothetical protein
MFSDGDDWHKTNFFGNDDNDVNKRNEANSSGFWNSIFGNSNSNQNLNESKNPINFNEG